MAPSDPPASGGAATTAAAGRASSPPDTPHGRLMRKTAEKCLHHLVVSRVTWMADDRALCDTSAPPPGTEPASPEEAAKANYEATAAAGGDGDHDRDPSAEKRGRSNSIGSGGDSRRSSRRGSRVGVGGVGAGAPDHPPPAPGPAYLTVDAVLAAANAESIDVRCRAIRLLSRLMSSPRCAAALGVSAVPALGRLVSWWLRTKDDPEAQRTPRPPESAEGSGGGGGKPAGGGGGGKKAAGGKGAAGKEAAAAAAAAEAAREEQAARDEAEALAAARLAAKRLEESDGTRVLRDEALAYALTVMLGITKAGPEERAAVGEDAIVGLLSSVLKRLPCTPEEFYANSGERRRSTVAAASGAALTGAGGGATASGSHPAAAGGGDTSTAAGTAAKTGAKLAEKSGGGDDTHPAPSYDAGGLLDPKPDMTLDLTLAHRRRSSGNNPRKHCCWRGENSRDPEVPLFSPLDWGWDFEVGCSQEPVQPGLVLRAATLRVLLAVADGYDPAVEAAAAAEASASGSAAASKGAAAAAAAEASARAAVLSGGKGARSVLSHALPVCFDLLSVDVHRGEGDSNGAAGEIFEGGGSRGNHAHDDAAVSPQQQQQQQQQHLLQKDVSADGGKPAVKREIGVEQLLGLPVSPSEELVHQEVRVACLRLLGSLLRLGGPAREAMLSVAAVHRGGGFAHLEEGACSGDKPGDAASTSAKRASTSAKKAGAAGDKVAGSKPEGGGEAGGRDPWVRPESFRSWTLNGVGDLPSIRASLPYVRTLSLFMLSLRNPEAPVTDILAGLVAMKRLCRESEHEAGGVQPDRNPQSTAEDAHLEPLPSSREGTAGVLVDTLAGAAVSLGVLVPLVSIWGCALAAAGSAVELAPEITGMVGECQELIDYLIRRGHTRESFWSSLPSLEQVAEANATEVATSKKAPRKSKGSAGKAGKGGGGGGGKGSKEPMTAALEMENDEEHEVPATPAPPAGRPDPNKGPDRASWGELLNTRVDERRTQTCGTTALLMATVTGLETAVANLLLAGADPNVGGSDGRSPLMCALAQGMDGSVRGLVEAGADVDAVNFQGYSVLKCAFLCPPRQAMRNIMRKCPPGTGGSDAAAAANSLPLSSTGSGRTGPLHSASSSRRSSMTPIDGGRSGSRAGRRVSSSQSESRSRSRSRSGSLTRDRRRSSLGRSVSFGEDAFATADPATAGSAAGGSGSSHRRLSRMASLSALDSARTALRDSARREPAYPLKTPRGTAIVRGDARMVPYILECGADPNVSSGAGDFPLHWAVTGTELTVRIMNQKVRIVAGGGAAGGGESAVSARADGAAAGERRASAGANGNSAASNGVGGDQAAAITVAAADDDQEQDLALLKTLIEAGSALDACNPEGMTALHAAVIAGRGTLAAALLDAGASPNVSDSLGCLPLHYACLRAVSGYADLASRMLALGMGRPLNRGVHQDLRKVWLVDVTLPREICRSFSLSEHFNNGVLKTDPPSE